MADDDRERRRQIAAAAFAARRGELGLTQQQVAERAGVAVRTVHNAESGEKWPNALTRGRLERAVRWATGELSRLASPPRRAPSPELLERVSQLTPEERQWLLDWLRRQDRGPAQCADG